MLREELTHSAQQLPSDELYHENVSRTAKFISITKLICMVISLRNTQGKYYGVQVPNCYEAISAALDRHNTNDYNNLKGGAKT